MQTFLVMHQLLGIDLMNVRPFFPNTAGTLAKALKNTSAEFRQCWYDSESGFLVCEWHAGCAEDIRAVLELASLPVESIHPVTGFSLEDMLGYLPAEAGG
jgi:hypothetical protein